MTIGDIMLAQRTLTNWKSRLFSNEQQRKHPWSDRDDITYRAIRAALSEAYWSRRDTMREIGRR